MSDPLKKFDHQLYRIERAIVVTSLVVMAIVVFLDVVHRTFSGEGSKLASAMAKVLGMLGSPIEEGSDSYQQLVSAAPYISIVVGLLLGYFGVRSAKRSEPVAPARAAIYAVGGLVVAYGLVRLLLVLLPNGLIWSQPLALVLTLWVGFVGASMCTYENKHLKVEAVQRFLPAKYKPAVAFLSGAATAAVCFALMWVSIRYVRFNYDEYVATEGRGGLFLGMDVPKYLGFVALPVSFAIMTARFMGQAIAALRGEIPEDDPTGGLLEARKAADDDELMPSEIQTEAIPTDRGGLKPSDIDTVSSRSDRVRAAGKLPPSEVNTQPHEIPRDADRDAAAAAGVLGGDDEREPDDDADDDDGDADDDKAKDDKAKEEDDR